MEKMGSVVGGLLQNSESGMFLPSCPVLGPGIHFLFFSCLEENHETAKVVKP